MLIPNFHSIPWSSQKPIFLPNSQQWIAEELKEIKMAIRLSKPPPKSICTKTVSPISVWRPRKMTMTLTFNTLKGCLDFITSIFCNHFPPLKIISTYFYQYLWNQNDLIFVNINYAIFQCILFHQLIYFPNDFKIEYESRVHNVYNT